jgi:Putative peptidoglycan binding domain/Patatin-like phospholipase
MPVLKRESSGPQVVALQKKLKALGFNPGTVNGNFDEDTEAALIAFQKSRGLTPDGMAGPHTTNALPVNGLDLPLHLFQVLEEEYISLYGQLEKETVINLKGRAVTSKLDWDFHRGHIKDLEKFQRHLQNLDPKFPMFLKTLLDAENVADWQSENDALVSLNRLLGKYFYSTDEFRHLTFSRTTEKLLELYPQQHELHRIATDELRRLNRFLLEELFSGHLESVRDVRLAAIYQRRHDHKSAAICLSGGGIRSGTFALGLLQGLARQKLLKHFDYLSTVSGGGYIGSWLTAWIHRHPEPDRGLDGVTKYLTNATPGSKIDPDPEAIRHLREYSNFLTPKAGLMSTDTWTFLAIYIRNLLLNWSVIFPLIVAFLLIPRFSVAAIEANPTQSMVETLRRILPARIGDFLSTLDSIKGLNLRHVFLFVGFICAAWAIAYIVFGRPSFRTRLIERNSRWKDEMGQRGFLTYCLLPLVGAAVLLTTYSAWTGKKYWWQTVLFGLLTALVGLLWSTYVLREWHDWRTIAITLAAGAIGGLFAYAGTMSRTLTNLDVDYNWATEFYVCTAGPLFLLLFVLALIVFAGLSSHLLNRVTDEDREWWARFSAWALISALAWTVLSTLVIFGPLALLASPYIMGTAGGLSGLVALLLGRSSKTPATEEKVAQGSWTTQLSSRLLPLLALLFIAFLVAALSLLTTKLTRPASAALNTDIPGFNCPFTGLAPKWFHDSGWVQAGDNQIPGYIEHMRAVHYPPWWFFLLLILLLTGIGIGLARLINLNLFSLHNGYRNRLIRGFLAASRNKQQRRPNPFTNFDPADNVYMHELRPALLHEVDFTDLDGFANELKEGGQALAKRAGVENENDPQTASEFLYTKLSQKGKDAAAGSDPSVPRSQTQRVDLIEDLNRILEADQIYLWKTTGFAVPSQVDDEQPVNPPPSQHREYHIHRNRQTLDHKYRKFIVASRYPPHRLLHVVNTTLNLVGGDNLAWQQRKAEPFTVSPLHCGSYRVGYRRSKDYGGEDGISLGTAMAISGAAASSNMGYYTTSPVLSLVLTLFNVRLGWWLGNPGPAGSLSYSLLKTADRLSDASKKIYRRMSPKYSVVPLFYEAFGLTHDRSKYVYLTDGGHFENLGLYEMVLRRCHVIVVSDAAADAKYEFNDLANAVRKVRVDLGIHIEFPDVPIYRRPPEKQGEGGCYWTIGLIRYSDIDCRQDGSKAPDGILIYIKPAVYEDEPEDVIHYKRTHPTFPHETTADQFFDEPQFESYRALGSYIMDRMCGSHSGELNIDRFVKEVETNLIRMAPQVKDKYCRFLPVDHRTY